MARLLCTFLCLACLSACADSPSPRMAGGQVWRGAVGAHDYTLYHKGSRVEVLRHGYAPRGTHGDIRETMIALVPQVTGCKLSDPSVEGDSGVMRARVNCPKSR